MAGSNANLILDFFQKLLKVLQANLHHSELFRSPEKWVNGKWTASYFNFSTQSTSNNKSRSHTHTIIRALFSFFVTFTRIHNLMRTVWHADCNSQGSNHQPWRLLDDLLTSRAAATHLLSVTFQIFKTFMFCK